MYGLIGKFKAKPGERDALVALLLEASSDMPGCRSYIVGKDLTDADGICVTEVWDSKELHAASLQIPAVRAVIQRAMPLIAGFGERFEMEPVGGVGLKSPPA